MHDAHIDYVGDKRRYLVAVQQLRARCYFDFGIPATSVCGSGRVGGTESDDSTREINVAPEDLRGSARPETMTA